MNPENLVTNIIFKDIIDLINKRNEIINEIKSLENIIKQKNRDLQKLNDDVADFKFDIDKFRLFFQTYKIILRDKISDDAIIYDVKNIELKQDSHGWFGNTLYYEITYDLSNLINKKIFSKNNKDRLEDFLHIFDGSKYSLIMKNK